MQRKIEKIIEMLEDKSYDTQKEMALAMEFPNQFQRNRGAEYLDGKDAGLCYAIDLLKQTSIQK